MGRADIKNASTTEKKRAVRLMQAVKRRASKIRVEENKNEFLAVKSRRNELQSYIASTGPWVS